jgi:uroporphyrinogen-III synthase
MRKVIVTRPTDQAASWLEALSEAGFNTIALPFIETQGLELPANAKAIWETSDAVMLVSANAVKYFSSLIKDYKRHHKLPRFWVTGPGTAKALIDLGVSELLIDYPDPDHSSLDSKGLWKLVHPQLDWVKTVLLVRGRHFQTHHTGNPWLEQQLQAKGVHTHTLVVYERKSPTWTQEQQLVAQKMLQQPVIWLLSSSEAIELAPELNFQGQLALVTHEKIAKTAQKKGFFVQSIVHPSIEKVIAGLKSIQ